MAKTAEGEGSPHETGRRISAFYQQARRTARVVKPHEIPWEPSDLGRKKDLVKAVKPVFRGLDACIHVLPPGNCSDRHRHTTEEVVYVLEGCGYDLHWEEGPPLRGKRHAERPPAPTRYDWQQGDTVYVPTSVLHQHFNLDVEKPARLFSATSRLPRRAAADVEQSRPVTSG